MKKIGMIVLVMFTQPLWAETTAQQFDGLSNNDVLLNKLQALEPSKKVSVVQGRVVSRTNRFEIAPEYSAMFGGDTYTRTQSVGLNVHYHITPRWSISARGSMLYNRLTPEGENMIKTAEQDYYQNPNNPTTPFPEFDYAKSERALLVNWYPIYGKMSLLDSSIIQYDIYVFAGAGQIDLKSGTKTALHGGGGFGFWLSKHISSRIEVRYENYKAKYYTGEKNVDMASGAFEMGWLL